MTRSFEELLAERWSCRAFKSDPVPRNVIEAVLRTAQRTASWNNVQPWQVHILSGTALAGLRDLMLERARSEAKPEPHVPFPTAYEGIYQDRRRACGFQLYEAVGVQRGDKPAYIKQFLRNFEMFDAPHAAVITNEDALGPYGVLDCGAYVTNFMTAATEQGVATIAQGALAMHAKPIHKHLGLSDNRRVVCGIAFGYADPDHPINQYRVPRADLDEVVHWVDG